MSNKPENPVFIDRSETREGLMEYLSLLEKLRSMSVEGTERYSFIKLQMAETESKLQMAETKSKLQIAETDK